MLSLKGFENLFTFLAVSLINSRFHEGLKNVKNLDIKIEKDQPSFGFEDF